jgi:hypothetical protein
LLLTNVFIVPIPRFRVDGLSNSTKNTQTAQIMTLNMMFSKSTQQPDGSGSGIELSQFVLCNRFPIARGSGVYGGGLEDGRGYAVGEGSVDDVSVTRMKNFYLKKNECLRVTRDPTHISHAGELVIRMNIEYIFDGQGSTQKISSCGVNHTLGLSGRSRGLKR